MANQMGYPMVHLMALLRAHLMVTNSGGLMEQWKELRMESSMVQTKGHLMGKPWDHQMAHLMANQMDFPMVHLMARLRAHLMVTNSGGLTEQWKELRMESSMVQTKAHLMGK